MPDAARVARRPAGATESEVEPAAAVGDAGESTRLIRTGTSTDGVVAVIRPAPTIASAPVAPVATPTESDLNVSVAVLPLVEAGLGLSGGDEGIVIDVALSVPLVTIPPVEITVPVIGVELPLPDLPLPDLPLTDLPVLDLSLPG